MPPRLFFDTELAHSERLTTLTEGQQLWDAWPLEISVAATHVRPDNFTELWHAELIVNGPRNFLPVPQVNTLLNNLKNFHEQGGQIFSWNGTGFDWRLLAALTDRHQEVVDLCLKSYDPMFQFLSVRGYPVGLNAVAQGFGLPEKTLKGGNVPMMWAEGMYEEVIAYVTGDVVGLANVVEQIEKQKGIRWVTQKGMLRYEFMPKLLTVEECLKMPEPYRVLMDRKDVIAWMS